MGQAPNNNTKDQIGPKQIGSKKKNEFLAIMAKKTNSVRLYFELFSNYSLFRDTLNDLLFKLIAKSRNRLT